MLYVDVVAPLPRATGELKTKSPDAALSVPLRMQRLSKPLAKVCVFVLLLTEVKLAE